VNKKNSIEKFTRKINWRHLGILKACCLLKQFDAEKTMPKLNQIFKNLYFGMVLINHVKNILLSKGTNLCL